MGVSQNMTLGEMGEGGVQKNKKLGGIIYEQPHITLSIGSDYLFGISDILGKLLDMSSEFVFFSKHILNQLIPKTTGRQYQHIFFYYQTCEYMGSHMAIILW